MTKSGSRPRQRKYKKEGIGEERELKPALKSLNSLIGELGNSEYLDEGLRTERERQTSSSEKLHSNATSHRSGRNAADLEDSSNQPTPPCPLFKRNQLFERLDSDTESEDGEGNLGELENQRRTKGRAPSLTEIERLEEAQTALEDRVRHVRELINKRDRSKNQRKQGQKTLERLETKLEMLDQRLEYERSGKSRWTFVRKVTKKPKVGFHSSELLNRKRKLGAEPANASFSEQRDNVIEEELEVDEEEREKSEEALFKTDPQSLTKPKHSFKTKALPEFHASLENDASGTSRHFKDEKERMDRGKEVILGSRVTEDKNDRKDIDKGWLRISDRPNDFVKKIDVSETHQSKQAWRNVSGQKHQVFSRRLFRPQTRDTNPLPPCPSTKRDREPFSDAFRQSGMLHGVYDEKGFIKHCDTCHDNINERKENVTGRSSPSGRQPNQSTSCSPRQRPSVAKIRSMVETNSFLPPIPKGEGKRRSKGTIIENVKEENDDEQNKVRFILLPNQKRVAKRRAELYIKQLDFVKSHGLDQEEVWKNAGSAIRQHFEVEELLPEHEAQTTPRNALYLIGALSRDHLFTFPERAYMRS